MSQITKKNSLGITISKSRSNLESLKSSALQKRALYSEPGESLVLLLDVSASMLGLADENDVDSKLNAAKKASLELIHSCDLSISEVGVCTFSKKAKLECYTASPLAILVESVKNISYESTTNITLGLELCREILGSSNRKVRRVILLSDGKDSNRNGVLNEVQNYVNNDMIIDTIAFGGDADLELLKKISELTKGVFQEVYNAKDLVKSFKQLEYKVRGFLRGNNK